MQIKDYVKPELLVVAVVLYFIGMWLKQSETVKDKYIPLINGLIGVAICAIYVFATCACGSGQDIALAVFTALTQGVLVAGLSTYVNQIFKQSGKSDYLPRQFGAWLPLRHRNNRGKSTKADSRNKNPQGVAILGGFVVACDGQLLSLSLSAL